MTTELSLREQQRWFVSVSTAENGVFEGAERASLALGRAVPIEQCVTDGPSLNAAERLAIYHEGYFARLVACLVDDYPALEYFLGEERFASLARAYIGEFPSRSPSLNAYGARMAEFCRARTEPWAPFAAELAELEWALVEVIHAPSAPGLSPEALAKVPASAWQTARLVASPTLRLLHFEHAVNAYFQAFLDGSDPEHPEQRPSATAVCRRGLPVTRTNLELPAATLLEDLLAGSPLESALARLAELSGGVDLSEKLPNWLASWVGSGFFSAIEY
jgi:hypothetical protein